MQNRCSLSYSGYTIVNSEGRSKQHGDLKLTITRSSNGKAIAKICITASTLSYTSNMVGTYDEVVLNDKYGYIYCFECYLPANILNILTNHSFGQEVRCVFDITTHPNGDSFVSVTVGDANTKYIPIILEFGSASADIGALTMSYLENTANLSQVDDLGDLSIASPHGIDGEPRECGAEDFYAGVYSVGALWCYHALQITNTGGTQYTLRMCSNSTSFKAYLKKEYGFSSVTSALIDSAEMSIYFTAGEGLYFAANGLYPENNVTKVDLPFACLVANNLITFFIPYTTSSTVLSASGSKAEWTLSKSSGWSNDVTDAKANDMECGLAVYANITGGVSASVSQINVPVYGTGTMRYKYTAYTSDAPTIRHLWLDNVRIKSSISIINP